MTLYRKRMSAMRLHPKLEPGSEAASAPRLIQAAAEALSQGDVPEVTRRLNDLKEVVEKTIETNRLQIELGRGGLVLTVEVREGGLEIRTQQGIFARNQPLKVLCEVDATGAFMRIRT